MAGINWISAVIVVTLSVLTQQQVALAEGNSPPTPVFATNYRVRGLISLPYAELNEPFDAYYDKNTTRSRTDYYGDLYKIYQFGPQSAPEAADSTYGSMYKLAWVPADVKLPTNSAGPKGNESLFNRIEGLLGIHKDLASSASEQEGKTLTKRACFAIRGDVGSTIQAQTVLPDLADFKFDSEGACPHFNHEHRHKRRCELWKLVTNVGEKKNTYKMWVSRDRQTGEVVPVHYYMLGYDSLLGSHYDRYDVSYFEFKANAALEEDFVFDASAQRCGSMPGPGEGASSGAVRMHFIVANPIREFVEQPHIYEHIDHEFQRFAADHQKAYDSQHHERKSWLNFMHNFRFINSKNRELQQFKLKVNKFADADVKSLGYLRGRLNSKGYNGGLDYAAHHKVKRTMGGLAAGVPESWDWNIRGAVTPVKDQAICGSCWSFGTSGSVEGAAFVKTGKLVRLSQQQLVDCSWKYGNNACDGGEDFRAYKYIMEAGGLASEEDYGSYLGVDGKCHDKDVPKSVRISGFYNVTAGDQEALKHAIVNYGPVSVSIDASRPTFTFYSHGVYYDEKCNNSPDRLDHSVLAVGYTKIDGQFVWQVKNSWSTYWGDNGYIMMSSKDNNCGVMDAPTVPIIQV